MMKRVYGVAALLGLSQAGCVVAGYSSSGGWFVWPGGIGLLIIIAILYFLFRGR